MGYRKTGKSYFGFTLIELMIVVIVVGILASMAYPNFQATREKALDKEALSALVLIRNSERMFFSRLEAFYPTPVGVQNNLAFINGNLSLDLNANIWAYAVGTTSATTFTAVAVRGTRTWSINNTANRPTCTGACF